MPSLTSSGRSRADISPRTIHGMVYNAMKLFMEINPQLFDDCSHEYTEHQQTAGAREALRERKWATIEGQANQRKLANGTADKAGSAARPQGSGMPRLDENDAEDNQKRLDSLKLQDSDRNQRRPATVTVRERQNSTGSLLNQR